MAIRKNAERGVAFGSTWFTVQSVNHRSLIPSSCSLRQGLSADVAARPSAHLPVPISINLTQNAITVQSAPVAASWCRAVCAVMSFLFPSLSLFSLFFFVDKFFDVLFLSFFVSPYPLFSAIGIDDESCKRAYGKSHVHPNIPSSPHLYVSDKIMSARMR